jgi:hypothetical protein
METRTDHELDGRLREALEPPSAAVGRVVRAALAAEPAERPARTSRLVPAVAGAAALLALATLFLVRPHPREAAVSIENVGEVLIVRHQEGGRVLIHNGEAAEGSSPSGSMIVIHGGTR